MTPKKKRKRISQVAQYEKPHWDPLLKLLAEYLVVDFMWMHEVELKDGTRIHAYKNRETRRYLHLSTDGRYFEYCGEEYYREAEISVFIMEMVTRVGRFRPCPRCTGTDDWDYE